MATWIVHLRLAEALLGRIDGLDAGNFAVGSIAPDSGIPDEKWETFDPPSWVTHFGVEASPDHELADLDFYRRHLDPLRAGPQGGHFPFRLGYFFHLVTDNLWGREIGRPTRRRWAEQFAADKDFIWEVKKDWYGLDFIYVRDHPECLFWRYLLTAQPETGGLEFLPLEAVRQRLAYVQEYYQRGDEKVQALYNRPYIYLSREEMDRFVDASARRLFRIYQYLRVDRAATEGFASALDLLLPG
jgi:hypothetical protein